MYRQSLRESKPSNQLVFSLLVILICGLAAMILSVALGWLIYGVNPSHLETVMQDLSKPETVSLLKFFQIFQTIGVFILPPLIIAWFLDPYPALFLRCHKRPDVLSLLFVAAIIFVSNPLINWLTELNSQLSLPNWLHGVEIWMQDAENQASKITTAFLTDTSVKILVLNLVMVAILPAIGEELLFRGIVQQLFQKMTRSSHAAIWISAAIFSAIHLQFFGFLPRLLLGAMFGYMLEWSGTLWLPIVAHFANNAIAVIAYYLMNKELIGDGIEKTGTSSDGSSFMVILSLIFLFVLFRALYLKRMQIVESN